MAYMINMDQTPVYYSINLNKTIEVRGMRTVHIKSLKGKSKGWTVESTIMAPGLQLQLLIIFKVVKNGRIAWEFATGEYAIGPTYECQENTWMDKEYMM